MVLLIDNYDSFSYNVYQLVGSIISDIRVIRNDELTVEEIEALKPSHIILSPGPGRPADAGVCEEVLRHLGGKIPVLGICLGHQAVCEVFGARITYAKELMHGKQSVALLDNGSVLFHGMQRELVVARYHSLAADPDTMPDCLRVTARTEDGEIMAVEHREYPIYGLQFHPESVLTPGGRQIMENFLLGRQAEDSGKVQTNSGQMNTGQTNAVHTNADEQKGNRQMIRTAIARLSRREDIGYEMAKMVMNEIMSGQASEVHKSAYLTALSMKGETIEEVTGSAEEMRAHALRLDADVETLEIVGTGGDGSNSFNISTTAAMVISAAGVPVAKHGNRAASSRSGAADCLGALGVNINIEPEKSRAIVEDIGICFLFAQKYHSAMKYVGPIRRELGVRTVFNILGPLTNPACPSYIVLGVYEEALLEPMAQVLGRLGIKKGMVVYGQEKLDEISTAGVTSVCELGDGGLKRYDIIPEELGFSRCTMEDLRGGTPEENAYITREILSGSKGPKRDTVLLNAGAALYVAGKCASLAEGVKLAAETIDSGKAMAQLEKFITLTNQ